MAYLMKGYSWCVEDIVVAYLVRGYSWCVDIVVAYFVGGYSKCVDDVKKVCISPPREGL